MRNYLRKLRGIVGTGLTWAVGWGSLFGGLWTILGFPLGVVLGAAGGGALLGACAGGSFAVILSIAEGRRTLDELSLKRIALWGGIGGMALILALFSVAAARFLDAGMPLARLLSSFVLEMGFAGLLGAGFATGSVALARRGDVLRIQEDDSEILPLEGR